ncbi:uncharacterized protein [Apostichopus japonicus]|uniref:uncharacterized protein n=1 Tax=Stichopus japonicus TaxID=307972 RepID=UPI003AB79EE3
MGKSRVVPLKPITMPRLELTAALLSVKISSHLVRELEFEDISEYFWTDSQVVLGYIQNDARRFKVFVANRVQQIRDHSSPEQWRYVSTTDNPADAASRGLTAVQLTCESNWFTGPSFLWEKDIPNAPQRLPEIISTDQELANAQVLITRFDNSPSFFEPERLNHISNWYRAKQAVALCLKLKSRLRLRNDSKIQSAPLYRQLTADDFIQAELEIVRAVQRGYFVSEIKSLTSKTQETGMVLKGPSLLYRLDPFIGEDGIIRVGGSLGRAHVSITFKHPIVLPRKHHIIYRLEVFICTAKVTLTRVKNGRL